MPAATYVGTARVGAPVCLAPCAATPSGWSSWFGRAGTRGFAAEASSWPSISGATDAVSPHSDASFSSEAGCVYKTVVSTQCFMERGEDGSPTRRCETLRRRFRQCPGRPVEELESTVEKSTEDHFPASSSSNEIAEGWPFSAGESSNREYLEGPTPIDLPTAKFFEDFFALAQQLQQGMDQEAGRQHDRLEPALPHGIPPGLLPPLVGEAEPDQQGRSLFGWLFGGSSTAPNQPEGSGPPNTGGKRGEPKQYQDYERDFQEI
eukprot:CAMPEP_0117670136 /NCGR_PEP_ID=MMETSP0804-20121206/12567_1 /TAXON_ID=1074897 /ORGANISM="Tetraselmis astigmatica, Strain CCMP880" /LENGTH=262 /DNA_ID=CAMNT_0005478365 /DNA_START=332 /DNA_END=1120 /DNA_ORIENTATION=-